MGIGRVTVKVMDIEALINDRRVIGATWIFALIPTDAGPRVRACVDAEACVNRYLKLSPQRF